MKDNCSAEEMVAIERKVVLVGRYENHRGEYLRITEMGLSHSHANSIILPLSGIEDFIEVVREMAQKPKGNPTKKPS